MSAQPDAFNLELLLKPWRTRALLIGVVALAVAVLLGLAQPTEFFSAYLFAWLFCLGIALGGIAIVMLHHLVGGGWGFVIRRVLEAAGMTLPLLAVLFVPILFGMPSLFSWTHPAAMADEVIRHKSHFFFNPTWFLVRAVLYFTIWIVLAWLLRRWSLEQDRTGEDRFTERFQQWCGPGLLLYVVTISLAAIDWVMALEPRWYSTIFGMLILCGQGLSAFAFAIPVAAWLARRMQFADRIPPRIFRDLGNMMLAFVLLWTYMAYSQYIITWSGNIADENIWYVHRQKGGWQWVGFTLILAHFACPFVVLLFGNVKRSYRTLSAVALFLLAAHLLDAFWLVKPAFHANALSVSLRDILLPIGLGGLWLAGFAHQLGRASLLPLHDPRLEAGLEVQKAGQHG